MEEKNKYNKEETFDCRNIVVISNSGRIFRVEYNEQRYQFYIDDKKLFEIELNKLPKMNKNLESK